MHTCKYVALYLNCIEFDCAVWCSCFVAILYIISYFQIMYQIWSQQVCVLLFCCFGNTNILFLKCVSFLWSMFIYFYLFILFYFFSNICIIVSFHLCLFLFAYVCDFGSNVFAIWSVWHRHDVKCAQLYLIYLIFLVFLIIVQVLCFIIFVVFFF